MRVYCPSCGTENEGMAGGRVTCKACTASFEVPPERPTAAPTTSPAPPLARPPPVTFAPPTGHSTFTVNPAGGPTTHPLAITSLVLGLLCCVPFAGVGAIVTGVMARKQIAAGGHQQQGDQLAVAGIALGALSIATGCLWGLSALVN